VSLTRRKVVVMVIPVARTSAEAHLYLDLHPCSCGEARFTRDSAVVVTDDGDLASRYTGECPRCGTHREFLFRLPEEILMPSGDDFRFGGPDPSQLLDPGEWRMVAEEYASATPADIASLPVGQRRQARATLSRAAAALDEVLKFVPEGADEVPVTAFTTERGRAAHAREPGRFGRARLVAVRDTYRELAGRVEV
jgi:hypothetical protein